MTAGHSETMVQDFDRLFGEGTVAGLTDAQLLDRFATHRDEIAFAALVDRHGPMVLGVCRGVLKDRHGAEDAFQATFLVLVRKAGSLRVEKSLAGWLCRVSFRIAVQANADARRRARRERQVAEMRGKHAAQAVDLDLGAPLFEEIDRLPEKYRVPIVLCGLEGLTHEAAARHLGCPVGTLSGRLSKARELLRKRLTRRGVALPAGMMVAGTVSSPVTAAVPVALVASTVRAAMNITAQGAISLAAFRLANGAIRSMLMTRLKIASAALAASGITLLGLGALAQQRGNTAQATVPTSEAKDPVAPAKTQVTSGPSLKILRDAYQVVTEAAIEPDRAGALVRIARAQAKLGDRPAALATLEYAARIAPKARPGDRGALLSAIAYAHWEVGDRGAIPAILREARNDGDRVEGDDQKLGMLMLVGEDLAWMGDLPAARECARKSREIVEASATKNDKYFRSMSLVVLLSQIGDLDEALKVADSVGDSRSLRATIASAAASGSHHVRQPPRELTPVQKERARELVHRILNAYPSSPPVEVVIALADLGDTDDAFQIARKHQWGDAAAWLLCRIAIAQVKHGRMDAARKTVQESLDLANRDPAVMKAGLNDIARGQVEIGDLEGALRTAEALEPGDRVLTFMTVAEKQAARGDKAGAKRTLERALENARTSLAHSVPSGPKIPKVAQDALKSFALWKVAVVQSRLGDFAAALETARQAPESRKAPSLFEVAREQSRAGKAEEVLAWVSKLDQPQDRMSAIAGLAEGLVLEKTGATVDPGPGQ